MSFDFNLKFVEAIIYLKEKVAILSEEFYRLKPYKRSLYFTIWGISNVKIIQGVKELILDSLETGSTFDTFIRKTNILFDDFGIPRLDQEHSERIFRTNIQMAYNVGRYFQITDPDVLWMRPYWMYDAINDSRTRPEHRALDGKIYPANHPFWDIWYPLNGFNCRCSVLSLSLDEIKQREWVIETEIPKFYRLPNGIDAPLLPDPCFAYNPGKIFALHIKCKGNQYCK